MNETIQCKATTADLVALARDFAIAHGHAAWDATEDSWRDDQTGQWVDGVSWIAPGAHALIRLRITVLGAGLTEVAGQIADAGDLQQPIDPRAEAELAGVLAAIRSRYGRPSGEDAARRGAPRLDQREDRDIMKEELREYLRMYIIQGQSQEVAASLTGKKRSTLERYRRTWPEIENEIRREAEERQARLVRRRD